MPAGSDPADDCPAEPVSICGRTGLCAGDRSCALWDAGAICIPPACADATHAFLADTCDGAGVCDDGGVDDCSPYTCDEASAACRTACASAGDCSVGDCCGNACLDTANDIANCGACGVACVNPHGTTSCAGGNCQPACDALWGSCDTDPVNGCETSLATLTDCGGCGVSCLLPGANATCATGTCELTSCRSSYSNCDGNDANGCELAHEREPGFLGCPAAVYRGEVPGDTQCGFICPWIDSTWNTFATWTDNREAWVKVRLLENSTCPSNWLESRFILVVPPGIDYDMEVYYSFDETCNGLTECGFSNNRGMGLGEQVTCRLADNWAVDDDRYLWAHIEFATGDSCSSWELYVAGHWCFP